MLWYLCKNYTTFGAPRIAQTVGILGSALSSTRGLSRWGDGRLACPVEVAGRGCPALHWLSIVSHGAAIFYLCSPQCQQRNLRRHAYPHREAKSPEAAVYVKRGLLQTAA